MWKGIFAIGALIFLMGCIRPPVQEISCEEYCREQPHAMCTGHLEITGKYPDCSCTFECETRQCIGQGGEVPAGSNDAECCNGLDLIPPKSPGETDLHGYCTSECGNNLCDNMIESPHNCPSDCMHDGNKDIGESSTPTVKSEEDMPEEIQGPELEPAEFETEWPNFQGNAARTGFSNSNAPEGKNVIWSFGMLDFDPVWPIVSDRTVFFANENVFAVDLESGQEKWSYSADSSIFPRGISAGEEKIFVSWNSTEGEIESDGGLLYALNKETGNFLWKYKTEKGISHSIPLYSNGSVFVGDDSGRVYAVSADSGKLIWKRKLTGAEVIHSSPALDGNTLFIGTENDGARYNPSYLYALNTADGTTIWKFEIDVVPEKLNLIHATPSVLEGKVYFGSENGYFYALSAGDGELLWKKKLASTGMMPGVSASAALGYGKIFVGTWEGNLFALSQEDGSILWQKEFGVQGTDSSALVADRKVYFASGDGYFYCFKEDSGEVIWKETFEAVSPAIASGILIAQNAEGENTPKKSPAIVAISDR